MPGIVVGHPGRVERLTTYVAHEDRIAQKLTELFHDGSSEIMLDSDRGSLQWRILDYLERKGWISDSESLLKKAFISSKKANVAETKKCYLAGKSESSLRRYRRRFTPRDQILCYQAAITGEFFSPFTIRDFTRLFELQFQKGTGPELIDFLSGLRLNKRARATGNFNPITLTMSLLWTSGWAPLWILPAQAISEVVRLGLSAAQNPTPAAINTAIRSAGLLRLPQKAVNSLFSARLDPDGREILGEISTSVNFDVSRCFRGASKSP